MHPHYGALIITLQISNNRIYRVLIDTISLVSILFNEVWKYNIIQEGLEVSEATTSSQASDAFCMASIENLSPHLEVLSSWSQLGKVVLLEPSFLYDSRALSCKIT